MMSSRSRSLVVFASLAVVMTLFGFLVGRMSVSQHPQQPIQATAPKTAPAVVKASPPAAEAVVPPESTEDEAAALASVKEPPPVERTKPEVVRAARAEEPIPVVVPPAGPSVSSASEGEKPDPDEVLKAKGLSRSGRVYVLASDDAIRTKEVEEFRQVQAEWERIAARMAQLVNTAAKQQKLLQAWEYECRQGYQAMAGLQAKQLERNQLRNQASTETTQKGTQNSIGDKTADLTDAAERNQWQILQRRNMSLEYQASELQFQLIQAQREYDQLGSMALAKEAEIQKRQAALILTEESVQKRYDDLANDRQVIAALADLNRDADLKFALGPVENYRANVSKMLSGLLQSKDLHASSKGKKLVVGLDQNVNSLAFQTTTFEDRLGSALSKQKDQQREDESRPKKREELAASVQRLEDQVANATQATRKAQLSAQLAGARAELANLQRDEVEGEEVRKKLAENVATNRDGYVQNVIALRKAVDLSQEKHDQLETDPTVKKAKSRLKATVVPLPKGALDILKKAEKLIQTVEIPVEADKTAFQVDAILNGQSQKLVVDPTIDVIRLSKAIAAELEIELSEDAPEFDLVMEDGRTLRAKRTTIKSLAVGPFLTPDVECLVVLNDYDAPPVLGANFLNQFSYKFDPTAGKLTLTQVNILPKTKPSERSRSSK
ncbi:retroviral-like aspartic protease family protein [Singulisphaera acidiphila]|uniref:Uncharacterized protein n=1 Tax=Singulisphaera acidiphila (strain ATCC BAA-1392 / DSM 18658 / VKM B-2454 / MOB10) TaxID=886293 RepID=L0DD20_SINAD|nr:retroviral-like aspartic protease family protein [Singulisphaera acidiphila]AGA27142.1 hypothetical protein Sinac_2850 [Singulisphaera acidiphila DSM 18658]